MVSQSFGNFTMKMDTQGMTAETATSFSKANRGEYRVAPPLETPAVPCFTDMQRLELKQMMREVLHEFLTDKNGV